MQDTYELARTGLTATVEEQDLQRMPDDFRRMLDVEDRPYGVEITLSEPLDGPLYPAVADEDALALQEELFDDTPAKTLYISGGETMIAFPAYDTAKAEKVVEHVLEKVDRYYDELGDAPLEHYLAKLPQPGDQ